MKFLARNRVAVLLALSVGAAVVASCATQQPPPPAAKPAAPAVAAPAPAAPPGPPPAPSRPLTASDAAVLAGNCFACHGPDGHSPGTIPSLNTLGKKRIISDLTDFRSGEAPSTVMGRQAKGYSDAEIEAIAEYISTLRKKP